jgi:hypothetical protein
MPFTVAMLEGTAYATREFQNVEGEGMAEPHSLDIKLLLPKVGLKHPPVLHHRIFSPVRLPYTWYRKHVAVILKVFICKAFMMPPSRTYIVATSL